MILINGYETTVNEIKNRITSRRLLNAEISEIPINNTIVSLGSKWLKIVCNKEEHGVIEVVKDDTIFKKIQIEVSNAKTVRIDNEGPITNGIYTYLFNCEHIDIIGRSVERINVTNTYGEVDNNTLEVNIVCDENSFKMVDIIYTLCNSKDTDLISVYLNGKFIKTISSGVYRNIIFVHNGKVSFYRVNYYNYNLTPYEEKGETDYIDIDELTSNGKCFLLDRKTSKGVRVGEEYTELCIYDSNGYLRYIGIYDQ